MIMELGQSTSIEDRVSGLFATEPEIISDFLSDFLGPRAIYFVIWTRRHESPQPYHLSHMLDTE